MTCAQLVDVFSHCRQSHTYCALCATALCFVACKRCLAFELDSWKFELVAIFCQTIWVNFKSIPLKSGCLVISKVWLRHTPNWVSFYRATVHYFTATKYSHLMCHFVGRTVIMIVQLSCFDLWYWREDFHPIDWKIMILSVFIINTMSIFFTSWVFLHVSLSFSTKVIHCQGSRWLVTTFFSQKQAPGPKSRSQARSSKETWPIFLYWTHCMYSCTQTCVVLYLSCFRNPGSWKYMSELSEKISPKLQS